MFLWLAARELSVISGIRRSHTHTHTHTDRDRRTDITNVSSEPIVKLAVLSLAGPGNW